MYSYINDRKIRLCVVGCGRISKNHFNSIQNHGNELELIAICDTNKNILEENESKYQVPGYQNMEDMLKREDADLVVLCTPSGLHPYQAILGSSYKVNVMTEKPMATRWKDALNMVRACDDAGVRLFVVKQNRYNSTIQLVKRALIEKRFGKIYMVHINVYWTRPQQYYDSAKWRGTWELDGGAFMNQASHYVDLLDWMIGPIASVQAMTGTLARDIEVEDSGVLNIRWRNGTLGSMSVTMLAYPKNFEGSITILGEKGTVKVGGAAVNDIQHWEFMDERDYDKQLNTVNYEISSIYGYGHSQYYENVIDVLRGAAEPDTDGREGLKSLEVLIAAYLSARDGKTISLPLEY